MCFKAKLIFSLLLLTWSQVAISQEIGTYDVKSNGVKKPVEPPFNSIIKIRPINYMSILTGCFNANAEVELPLRNYFSFSPGIQYCSFLNIGIWNGVSGSMFSVRTDFKYYIPSTSVEKKLNGFFLGPYAKIGYINIDQTSYGYSIGPQAFFGGLLGYQYTTNKFAFSYEVGGGTGSRPFSNTFPRNVDIRSGLSIGFKK